MVDYRDTAASLARQHGIPEDLFLALIQQESGWNPSARSPAGAYGLGQLMPGTADYLGVDPNDPYQNLEGSARYLAEQHKRFGNWNLALAGYNAGPGNVSKYGGIPPFDETQNYVRSIMGNALLDGSLDAPGQQGPQIDMAALQGLMQRNALAAPEPSYQPPQGLDVNMFLNRRRYAPNALTGATYAA